MLWYTYSAVLGLHVHQWKFTFLRNCGLDRMQLLVTWVFCDNIMCTFPDRKAQVGLREYVGSTGRLYG